MKQGYCRIVVLAAPLVAQKHFFGGFKNPVNSFLTGDFFMKHLSQIFTIIWFRKAA